jgi:outer membrane protein assembly factor BamB
MPALAPTQQIPTLAPEKSDQPQELPPGVWEPPPVRRGSDSKEEADQLVEEIPEDETHRPLVNRRRAWVIIVGSLTLLITVLGIATFVTFKVLHKSEQDLSNDADALYKQGSFSAAGGKYEDLLAKFPNSEHKGEYEFMMKWCDECTGVSNAGNDLVEVADRLDTFIREHKNKPPMIEHGHDAGLRVLDLAKALATRTVNPPDENPLAVADRIEQARRTVTGLGSNALTRSESEQIDADLGKVRKAVEIARKRRHVAAELKPKDKEPLMDAIKRARAMLAQMERELPGITQESQGAVAELEQAHLASVVYQPATDAPAPATLPSVDDADVLLFAPLIQSFAPDKAPPNDPIVLALVRGVLYALKQTNGELKWATHVGIDTTVLPHRVPASAFTPELLLVLSAETRTLSALDVDGNALWEYPVGQPVLGRPVIIEQRAYLADYSGWVHEIELSRGQLLGRWYLGQPLTCGGAREEGTSRIYFPADDSCIYVLDVNPKSRRCVTILYDGHPSGSLRSEPVIIPPEGNAAPGFLILNQASGLDAMRLHVFELPLQDRHASPLDLKSAAGFAGWTWFEPKQDGEKLAVLSDAGRLGLFGIHQLGNNDPPLFPLLRSGELDLTAFLHAPGAPGKGRETSRERGRSLVVHMRSDDLWVLANGRYQQLHLRLNPTAGPQAVPGWKTPLVLGSPLHEPQRFEDRNGYSTFYLVTQALDQQTSLATAVDEQGKIKWQRQLGLVCQGEPIALTPPGGGPPVLLTLDQGGGLFALDPLQPHQLRSGGQALKPALAENPLVPPRLLLAADGSSAYEIAVPSDGQELVVRHIKWAAGGRQLNVEEERKVSLLAPAGGVLTPIGPPTVTESQLLIPMTDGSVRGVTLSDEKWKLATGPEWRQGHPPVSAPYILGLGQDRFLTTNGNRGLSVVEWPPGKNQDWQRLPRGGDPLVPLEYLVAAPPVLLPDAQNQPARVAVADSAGILRLYTVPQNGSLQPGLTWELKGNLTAGPFVQAVPGGSWRIGCVLDRRRLVWIDPAKAEPLWTYPTDGPAIIGQPQWIEDMLVVALQSGHYVGIDPNSGQAKGPGYTLRTSAAPAATPMSFGAGRMFTPLSDGTALLLSIELLRQKKP